MQVPASRIRPVNMHEHTASEARSDTASAATGAAASGSTNRFSASTTAAASAARSTPGTKALSVGDSVIANWRVAER